MYFEIYCIIIRICYNFHHKTISMVEQTFKLFTCNKVK